MGSIFFWQQYCNIPRILQATDYSRTQMFLKRELTVGHVLMAKMMGDQFILIAKFRLELP